MREKFIQGLKVKLARQKEAVAATEAHIELLETAKTTGK